MKNLSNCTGVEFLKQTNKIRHAVKSWITEMNFKEIRSKKPDLIVLTTSMTEKEMEAAKEENMRRTKAQAKANIDEMLDIALEKEPEKTLKVLSLMCFMEDDANIDAVMATELLANFAEMVGNEAVLGFFSSLMKSGLMDFFASFRQ